MKTKMLMAAALTVMVAACAQASKPEATIVASKIAATTPPAALASPAAEPMDSAAATAQRNLKALGYAAGRDPSDPALARAIQAFEKDQGMTEDGRLTPAVSEKLRLMRAALQKAPPDDAARDAAFVYSDGLVRRQPLGLLPAPQGLVSDAPANLLQPLRPGAQASYNLGRRGKDGHFSPVLAVTCHTGHMTQTSMALGLLDILAVDCHGEGKGAPPLQWRAIYSLKLGVVTRQDGSFGNRELVAIRPVTGDWPSAARTGLDWALTHALDMSGNSTVPWSSTAVASHFEISAGPRLAGSDAGLGGRYAKLSCRRFNLAQSASPSSQYPGIACQTGAAWSLPGSRTPIASSSSQSPATQSAL